MPGMTMAEKILSLKTGRRVSPGEFVAVPVDLAYAHDGTAPLAIQVMEEEKLGEPRDPSRIAFVIDHASPAPSVAAARTHALMRRFAERYGIRLFDVGEGICHQVIAESGLVKPGMLVVGADSHTVTLGALGVFATGVGSTDMAVAMATGKVWLRVPESVKVVVKGRLRPWVMGKDVILHVIGSVKADGMTYRAVEFQGGAVENMSVDSRMTLSNMSVEMGAKAGLIPVDDKTLAWLGLNDQSLPSKVNPDSDAEYTDTLFFDAQEIEPQVARPPNVDNVVSVSEVEGVEVNQVFIGSCTNGRFEDLLVAAKILKGRRVKRGVRCIVSPASRRVYLKLLDSGIIRILLEAGCVVGPPTCGPCIGAHMGLLGEGEVAVSTSNRNFTGRMGDKTSRVYLASPATAATTAIEGRITDPRTYWR